MRIYVDRNRNCKSKPVYKRDIITHLNRRYRRVPDNIGNVTLAKNAECELCKTRSKCTYQFRELKCGHVFHKRCIDNWLIDNRYRCYVCDKWQLT